MGGALGVVKICDVGSMPLKGQRNEFLEGAKRSQTLTQYLGYGEGFGYVKVFEDQVVSGLEYKIKAGVEIPTYPQLKDMNKMFLEMIRGLTKTPKGYVAYGKMVVEPGKMIPEVYAVRSHLGEVAEASDASELGLKICVMGPYTLSRVFSTRTPELLEELGGLLGQVISSSIFKSKRGRTALISIDKPAFGITDDPTLDNGQSDREYLRRAWEEVAYAAKSRGWRR